MTNDGWRVIGTKGCGSVLAEAALVLAGVRYEREEVDYATPGRGAIACSRSIRSARCRRWWRPTVA